MFCRKRSQLLYHSERLRPRGEPSLFSVLPLIPLTDNNSEGKDGRGKRKDTEGGAKTINMKAQRLRVPQRKGLIILKQIHNLAQHSGLGLASQSLFLKRNKRWISSLICFHCRGCGVPSCSRRVVNQLLAAALLCLVLFCAHSFHVAGIVCLLLGS